MTFSVRFSIHRSFTSRIHFECQHRECMRFCLRDRAVPTQKESRLQRKLYLEDRVWHVRENLFVYFRKVVQNQDVATIRPLSALNAHLFWIQVVTFLSLSGNFWKLEQDGVLRRRCSRQQNEFSLSEEFRMNEEVCQSIDFNVNSQSEETTAVSAASKGREAPAVRRGFSHWVSWGGGAPSGLRLYHPKPPGPVEFTFLRTNVLS